MRARRSRYGFLFFVFAIVVVGERDEIVFFALHDFPKSRRESFGKKKPRKNDSRETFDGGEKSRYAECLRKKNIYVLLNTHIIVVYRFI